MNPLSAASSSAQRRLCGARSWRRSAKRHVAAAGGRGAGGRCAGYRGRCARIARTGKKSARKWNEIVPSREGTRIKSSMEQFPKIARARMAAHAPGEHPEAEQLNAFAENALAAQERESVLAHLAACEDCREIVGLAVEARPEGAPLVKPARDGFRWATFQWAAVAASVAIVTVAVLVVGPKETREPQRATETVAIERQQPESQPAAKVPETPLADLKVGRAVGSKSDASVKPKEAEKKLNGGTGAGVGIGSGISGGGFGGGVYKVEETTNADAVTKLQQKKEAGPVEPAAKPAPSRGLAYSVPASSANDTFYSSTPVNRPAGGSVTGGIAQRVPPPSPGADGDRARAEEQ